MADIRQVTIKIRDRQVSGGTLPIDAKMAEPFVNLYDGIMKFSGVTGGGFESSAVSSVFEVGSTLYNSKITNRFNINDNFIISGDTGKISTYNGITGIGLSGKFLSGVTGGFVLGDISDIQGIKDITRVQPGTNILTGGTGNLPIVSTVDSPIFNNLTFSGTAIGGDITANDIVTNTLSAITSLSATTYFSGGTSLETIIENISTSTIGPHTKVQEGTNIVTGGTSLEPTVSLVDSPSVNILTSSGHVITNGTIYSGGTIQDDGIFTIDAVTQVEIDSDLLPVNHLTNDLGAVGQRWNELFIKKIRLGTSSTTLEDQLFSSTTGNFTFDFAGDLFIDNNVIPNVHDTYNLGITGTRWKTIYAQDLDLNGIVTAIGITNSSLTSGRVVYAGTGGILKDESGFEYDELSNLLKTGTIQIGNPGDTGTTATIYGDIVVIGDAISGFTSELYIEDNLIELNYNPTASTTATSLGAGWSIQDGSGSAGTPAVWDIRGASVGLTNRSFTTNLGNIIVAEAGTVSAPNGLYVIKETDTIDGGSY